MSQELKPCPFCGGTAEIKRLGTHRRSMLVGCTDCHCELESCDESNEPDRLAWNRRKTPQDLLTALSELLEICRWKCSPGDEVVLASGKTNHQALVEATAVFAKATEGKE